VFDFGGADTSFPLFVFVFLVALGIVPALAMWWRKRN
jgi:hypothetical protein